MTLGLIAGQGGLPPQLVRVLLARGEVPVVCEIEQFPSDVKGELPRLGFRLETLGNFIATAKEVGVTRICMAGAMRRPPIDPTQIDAATMPLVPKVQAALSNSGDDSTLRIFTEIFEEAGIEVIGAVDIDPSLLPPEGLTGTLPDGVDQDIAVAEAALAELAAADAGQAVVVRGGKVIAREDARGTDAMLSDLCPETPDEGISHNPFEMMGDMLDSVADWLSGPVAEARAAEDTSDGGILFKAPKPGQELRVDMPLIGLGTVMRAAEAGLAGIVIEAAGVMLLDPEGVAEVLRAQGMFMWVRPRGGA